MRINDIICESTDDWDPSTVPLYHGTAYEFSREPITGMWMTKYQDDAEQYARELGHGEGGMYVIQLHPHKSVRVNGDLNTIPKDLPPGTQTVHDDMDVRVIDPKVIKSMEWVEVPALDDDTAEEY